MAGAYIFRPDRSNATATPVATGAVNLSVLSTSVLAEARQVFAPWLSQIIRLTAGSSAIEFEWTVGHIPVNDGLGKEIITRFTTDLPTAATWYTDSNGREFMKRVRSSRPTWQWNATEVTAGQLLLAHPHPHPHPHPYTHARATR